MHLIENDASNNSLILAHILVGMVTDALPINHRRIFTEPLPGSDRVVHIETHRLMGGIHEVGR
jgi:hypothetical protein